MLRSDDEAVAGSRQVLLDLPAVSFLTAEARELVVHAFVPMHFAFGQSIIRQGDPGDGFYVLASGMARAVLVEQGGHEIALGVLLPGDSFGEDALLTGAPRSATIRASSDVTAFRLEPAVFQALLRLHPQIESGLRLQGRARHLETFLRVHSAFSHLPRAAIAPMLAELQEIELPAGACVIREGDPPGPLFIVMDGRLVAYQGEERRLVGYERAGDFFGELSLFRGTPRAATVEAVTPGVPVADRGTGGDVRAGRNRGGAARLRRGAPARRSEGGGAEYGNGGTAGRRPCRGHAG
jgi:CRP-like cAMP-binding protein